MQLKGHPMEKQITKWAYWLGIVCLVVAVIWRVIKLWIGPVPGVDIAPLTLYRGASLFFLAAIASSTYVWMRNQQP